MKLTVVAISLLVTCANAFAAPYEWLPDARQVQKDISELGAKDVLGDLIYGDEKISNDFLKEVGSGDAKWLDVAVLLRPFSDAGSSEDLQGSVSKALANQPRNVLRLMAAEPSLFSVDAICSGQFGFIEEPLKERAWRRKTMRAVLLVKEKSLIEVRGACIRQLQARPQGVSEAPNPSFQHTARGR